MRPDMQKVLCERERGNGYRTATKRFKIDPNQDFENFEQQHTKKYRPHRRRNHRVNALKGLLRKHINGRYASRCWDDVLKAVCERADIRSHTGRIVHEHLKWLVALDVEIDEDGTPRQLKYSRKRRHSEYFGFYVDFSVYSFGILRENKRVPSISAPDTVESIQCGENTWFKLEVFRTKAECGCVHFRYPSGTRFGFNRCNDSEMVCIHGNAPVARPIWYVVEYGHHKPDEIYKVHTWKVEWHRRAYNLKEGEKHIVYYRDVPDELARPFEARKKVANRKELQEIRKALASV